MCDHAHEITIPIVNIPLNVSFKPKFQSITFFVTGNQEKRGKDRVFTQMPVNLEAATGVTRDVSETGLYIETDAQYAVGSEISVSVEVDTPGGKMILRCRGNIVRIEPRETKVGLAVHIIASTMESLEQT